MVEKRKRPLDSYLNIAGERFGSLVAMQPGPNRRQTRPTWLCRCDCGNFHEVITWNLTSGSTKSCGCRKSQSLSEAKTVHGHAANNTTTPEFSAWSSMKGRCHTPTWSNYNRYGARGIYVCDRWRYSFENFLADMGARPSPKHSLGRINNDGPYSPENCRWETVFQQQNNRSNCKLIKWNGKTQTVSEWARELGFPIATLKQRLQKLNKGWTIERAMTQPYEVHVRNKKTSEGEN